VTPIHESYLSAADALERLARKDGVPALFKVSDFLLAQAGDPPRPVADGLDEELVEVLQDQDGRAFLLAIARRMRARANSERLRAIDFHKAELQKLEGGI